MRNRQIRGVDPRAKNSAYGQGEVVDSTIKGTLQRNLRNDAEVMPIRIAGVVSEERCAGIIVYKIVNGDPVFLVLIKNNGEYDLPKGHLEEGENAKLAALRETKEETGLETCAISPSPFVTSFSYTENGRVISKTVEYFVAKVMDDEVNLSFEHKDYEWVNLPDIFIRMPFENIKILMQEVFQYVNGVEGLSG